MGGAMAWLFVAQLIAAAPNPYLEQAKAQLAKLDERAALQSLAQAENWAKDSPLELAQVQLYEGLAHAGLNEKAAAEDAFRAAILLNPTLFLPADASPVVWAWWREAGGQEPVAPPAPQTSRAWWIPAAVAVALGAAAGVCYGEALSRYNALTGPTSLGYLTAETEQSAKTQGANFQVVAFVSGGAGVAAVGTAVAMAVWGGSPSHASVSLAPAVGPAWVGVQATF
jgi:hypothetical protein